MSVQQVEEIKRLWTSGRGVKEVSDGLGCSGTMQEQQTLSLRHLFMFVCSQHFHKGRQGGVCGFVVT